MVACVVDGLLGAPNRDRWLGGNLGGALQGGGQHGFFGVKNGIDQAVLQCAAEIASKPPIAIWGTKQAIHYARDHSVDDALKQMGWLQGAIWSNRHVMESVKAMKSKATGEFPELKTLTRFMDAGQ